MTDTQTTQDAVPPRRSFFAPIGRAWARVSPSLVPVLAVMTALIAIIPLMVVTQGRGNIGRGLEATGQTYAGLMEGAIGFAFNSTVSESDVAFALEFVQASNAVSEARLNAQGMTVLARRAEDLARVGRDNVRFYAEVIERYYQTDILPDNVAFDQLGNAITEIQRIGADRLRDYGALIDGWNELATVDVRDFGELYGDLDALDEATRARLDALLPELMLTDDQTLLGAFALMRDFPFVQLVVQTRNVRDGDVTDFAEQIGVDNLQTYGDVFLSLDDLRSTGVLNAFVERFGLLDVIDLDAREQIEVLVPVAAEYDDDELFDAIRLLRERTLIRLTRALVQLRVLDRLDLQADDDDAQAIAAIHRLSTDRTNPNGISNVQRIDEADRTFIAAGIEESDIPQLAAELRLVANLYNGVLTRADVERALSEELPVRAEEIAIIRRPNSQVLVLQDLSAFGMTQRERTRVTTSGSGEGHTTVTEQVTVPDRLFARVFDHYVLFSPASLEQTLTRSLPFIIAGLAVALGFKAGLFNIGAEGQLYMGATLAAWFGFSPLFGSLHPVFHVPLVLMGGLIGGALWGMIPGILKAYTGAHEVINTIMLNFIAIRLTDWLIKSTNPYIIGDPNASAPRTPFLDLSARLTKFDQIGASVFIMAGLLVAAFYIFMRYNQIKANPRAIIRPIIYGVMVAVGGFALRWLTVGGNLHIGLVVMLLTVILVDWFLERTTIGFELRTVGANADAAQYAGMNVKRNVIIAMTLSGALAGLAGIVEIGGVQYSMEPAFFSGLGFDAIAVALLARNNPRYMIPAGILWGALLTGAAAIQVYNIPIDLVNIIQALIIMFIAADAIIRVVYRIPEATEEEKSKMVFSTGWGS